MIEREKIRHRRPDDMRHHDHGDEYYADEDELAQHPDTDTDEASATWSDEEEGWPDEVEVIADEQQGWDNEADDEWVFDESHGNPVEDDSGVVWEEEDIAFGSPNTSDYKDPDSYGPEVELAGRRDTRPRPPKRASAPRPDREAAPRQRMDINERQFSPPRTPGPAAAKPPPNRFARTQRATMEIIDDRPAPPSQASAPSMQNRRASSRRLNVPPPPTSQAPKALTVRIPFGKILVVACLVFGGWMTYQGLGTSGPGEIMTRVAEMMGLSSSGRSAADTSFGTPSSTSPEEALANLTGASNANNVPDTLSPNDASARSGSGPSGTNQPPFPKFKPRDEDGQAEIQASNGGTSPSIFERLWSYF